MAITTTKELKDAYPTLVDRIIKEALGEDMEATTKTVKDKNGIAEWVEELRDSEGNLISKRVDKYSYYPTGEIDVITQQRWDEKGKMTEEKRVKHYTTGRQPAVVYNTEQVTMK